MLTAIKMNDEMIKYKKVENERARHMVNTLSVNRSPYMSSRSVRKPCKQPIAACYKARRRNDDDEVVGSCRPETSSWWDLSDAVQQMMNEYRGAMPWRINLLWTPAQFCQCFFFIYFYGRLILRPWWTEVRESFTRGGPWVSLKKLLLGFFSGHP